MEEEIKTLSDEESLKNIIAANLIRYRKANNLTQLELAEKLSYSDKAISKWERGESIPDVVVLMSIAKIYNVTLNDLTTENKQSSPKPAHFKTKIFVLTSSILLVWLVATIIFVGFKLIFPGISKGWLSFIYAIPVSCIVATVFSSIWKFKIFQLISISLLVWTLALTIHLTFGRMLWLVYIIAIPLQTLSAIWFAFRR